MTRALTAGRRLARNSIFNLIGQALPLPAAVFAIPRLIKGLGTDRFAVLTIAWLVIGYFSLFDLGLGRALTQVVARGTNDREDAIAPPIAWTALGMMLVLGTFGALAMVAISPWMVHSALKIPVALQAETVRSFYLLAACIPIVVVTSGLIGILSAFQRFDVLNAIRVPMGLYNFLGPLAILGVSTSLVAVVAVLVIGRVIAAIAHLIVCLRNMPPARTGLVVTRADLRPVFQLGAWMTVTNIIGPILLNVDRFVIGSVVSVSAVAYYATPYEMVARLQIVPAAVVSVLFPAFAASYLPDHDRMVRLLTRGTKYIAILLFPVILVLAAFAPEILQWWVGSEFARHSTVVLQCLAIGAFVLSVAHVFSTLVQGVGRPDLTAKLQMVELPVYVLILWWSVAHYGIVGAAVAWVARITVDGVLLLWISGRFLGEHAPMLTRMSIALLAALGSLALPPLIGPVSLRAGAVALLFFGFLAVAWFAVLADDERAIVKNRLRRVRWSTG